MIDTKRVSAIVSRFYYPVAEKLRIMTVYRQRCAGGPHWSVSDCAFAYDRLTNDGWIFHFVLTGYQHNQ